MKHLNYLIYNDFNEMMFCDFINNVPFLYDAINIETNTINIINNNFELYYVEPQSFYTYFRNKLTLILPYYYKMIKNEVREELFNLSNNTNYRRLADAKVDDLLGQKLQKVKTVKDNDENVKQNSTTSNTSNTESNSNNKNANKQNPLSIEGSGDFDDVFDWSSSSSIDETTDESESTTKDNGTNDSSQNRTVDETIKTKATDDIKQLTHSLTDQEELNKGQTILCVEAIEKINDFLMSNNKSTDYLIKQLKPLFINCE